MSRRAAAMGAAMLLGVAGCDDTRGAAESPDAGADAAVEPQASAEEKPAPAPPPPPEKLENQVTFSSRRIGSDGFTLSHTEAAKRSMSTGAKPYVAIIVDLANYDRQGGDYLPNPSKDGQRRVTLNFAAKGEPAPGKYPIDGRLGESNKLSVGIHTRDEHIGLIAGSGEGEITHIDDKTVRGKVSVKDEQGTSIEATFDVAYTTAE